LPSKVTQSDINRFLVATDGYIQTAKDGPTHVYSRHVFVPIYLVPDHILKSMLDAGLVGE